MVKSRPYTTHVDYKPLSNYIEFEGEEPLLLFKHAANDAWIAEFFDKNEEALNKVGIKSIGTKDMHGLIAIYGKQLQKEVRNSYFYRYHGVPLRGFGVIMSNGITNKLKDLYWKCQENYKEYLKREHLERVTKNRRAGRLKMWERRKKQRLEAGVIPYRVRELIMRKEKRAITRVEREAEKKRIRFNLYQNERRKKQRRELANQKKLEMRSKVMEWVKSND